MAGCTSGVDQGDTGQGGGGRSGEGRGDGGALQGKTRWATGQTLRVQLLTLARAAVSDKAVVARFRITNTGFEDVLMANWYSLRQKGEPSISGVSLVDSENRKEHLAAFSDNGGCLCTTFDSDVFSLAPSESLTAYAYLSAPPPDVQRATVFFPHTRPFFDVPIGARTELIAIPEGQEPRRPQGSAHYKAIPVVSLTRNTEGSSTVRKDADKTQVRLSADVLFELNEATITPQATEELRAVARRIKKADPQVVHVDGYTDNTGGPRINEPLSRQRARNVADKLRKWVPDDVRFEVQGHGAKNPIADNSTKKGRQRNRRVTVTFHR